MPITATPATPRMLTIARIRMAMRDVAGAIPNTGDANVLLDGVQFSDEEIENALNFTVEWYNSITPLIGNARRDNINNYVLYLGATSFLCQAEQLKQARNEMQLQDGDVANIGKDAKQSYYGQMAQVAAQRFEQKVKEIKIQINMESAWGAVSSGYRSTARNHNS